MTQMNRSRTSKDTFGDNGLWLFEDKPPQLVNADRFLFALLWWSVLAWVTNEKEIEKVGKADLISDINKKEVKAADPNGKNFNKEMKTDLLIQSIKKL